MLGAFLGATIVYAFYFAHFGATTDANAKLACFCTTPAIRNLTSAFFCEVVGTFLLVFPIFLMVGPSFSLEQQNSTLGLGALGELPVGLLVFAIGLSLGGTTGYAINPARDLGPRLAHATHRPFPGSVTVTGAMPGFPWRAPSWAGCWPPRWRACCAEESCSGYKIGA